MPDARLVICVLCDRVYADAVRPDSESAPYRCPVCTERYVDPLTPEGASIEQQFCWGAIVPADGERVKWFPLRVDDDFPLEMIPPSPRRSGFTDFVEESWIAPDGAPVIFVWPGRGEARPDELHTAILRPRVPGTLDVQAFVAEMRAIHGVKGGADYPQHAEAPCSPVPRSGPPVRRERRGPGVGWRLPPATPRHPR